MRFLITIILIALFGSFSVLAQTTTPTATDTPTITPPANTTPPPGVADTTTPPSNVTPPVNTAPPANTVPMVNSSPVVPQFVPQTQMNLSGDLDVDLKQANVNGNVLTVILVYRNSGQKEVGVNYSVSDVYYIDKKENKKYSVLKDEKGEWIAAPVGRGKVGLESPTGASPLPVGPSEKKVVWFKFPAPPEVSNEINIVIPDVIPYESVNVNRMVNTN